MQCHSLRKVILDYWRNQLDNGLAYANIIFYGLEVGDMECIKAANERFQQIEIFPNDVEL